MRPTLVIGEREHLRAALTNLLAPLDAADAAAWRRQSAHAVQQLIGADGCAIMLDMPGEPVGIAVGQWEGAQPVIDTWTKRYRGGPSNRR